MKKGKISLILIGLLTSFSLGLTGCGGKETDAPQGHGDSKDEIDVDMGDVEDMDDIVPDDIGEMTVDEYDDYEFFIMRVGDSYIEFPSANDYVNLDYEYKGDYPDMTDGQIAKVLADVYIYNCEANGQHDTIFIRDLLDYEILDYDELDNFVDIPNAGSTDYVYYMDFFKYEYEDTVYILASYCGDIKVYADGVEVFNYSHYSAELDFARFFDYLYGIIDETFVYVPDFAEDEILNMTDDDLIALGRYAQAQAVEEVSTPNPLRDEYNLTKELGYYNVGEYAYASASDEDHAMEIAMDQWYTKFSDYEYYTDFELVDYNGQFWLFSAEYYNDDEYGYRDTMIVYDESYYEVGSLYGFEKNSAHFELTYDNILELFSYQNMDDMNDDEFCIGEFLNQEDDTWIFRKYYVYVDYGDYETSDEVNLYYHEWTIESDGTVEQKVESGYPLKAVEM